MLKEYWGYIADRDITRDMNKLEIIQARIINQIIFIKGIFCYRCYKRPDIRACHKFLYFISNGVLAAILFLFGKARLNPYNIFAIFLLIGILVFIMHPKTDLIMGLPFIIFHCS